MWMLLPPPGPPGVTRQGPGGHAVLKRDWSPAVSASTHSTPFLVTALGHSAPRYFRCVESLLPLWPTAITSCKALGCLPLVAAFRVGGLSP